MDEEKNNDLVFFLTTLHTHKHFLHGRRNVKIFIFCQNLQNVDIDIYSTSCKHKKLKARFTQTFFIDFQCCHLSTFYEELRIGITLPKIMGID